MMKMAETWDSTFIICQLKLLALSEGNILGRGFSSPLLNNVCTAKWTQERYIQCGLSMISWVNPYPFIDSIQTLNKRVRIDSNLRVWINFFQSSTTVCLIIYAKIVPITKNAVQRGVQMKMSPTQNPTILKCIAMDRTKRREGAKNRSSLDVS